MTRRPTTNVAASIRQRLRNQARADGQDFQLLLTHFGIERLLYRLAHSSHAERFVLKGAMLFRVWEDRSPRQTQDLDLLGRGDPDTMAEVFAEIAGVAVTPDDGLVFDAGSVHAEPIRDQAEYRGVRLGIEARLGSARMSLQIDVGFGDAVTPGAVRAPYPTLLDLPAPVIRMYPRETVVAEKFQAIVALSTANTRMKDYFDLWHVAENYTFDGAQLGRALHRTFERRATSLPDHTPPGLAAEYLGAPARMRQWKAIVQRSTGIAPETSLSAAGAVIAGFLMPATATSFSGHWEPGGPWLGHATS